MPVVNHFWPLRRNYFNRPRVREAPYGYTEYDTFSGRIIRGAVGFRLLRKAFARAENNYGYESVLTDLKGPRN